MNNNSNNKNIEFFNGYYWPISDSIMRKYIMENNRLNEPEKISLYCEQKRVCLQAGGNVGIYPKLFSPFFEKVITFEPEIINYECLLLNTKDCNNITSYNKALGNCNKKISIRFSNQNCGGHGIQDGNDIEMIKIDDLNLENLDLIQLDVEGLEIDCLQGGIETIKKCNPVICVEVGWSNASEFLDKLGYKKIIEIDVNWIFQKTV